MSISVGSMSAGLSLDMSQFQTGMARAAEVAESNTQLMSAQMKRTSREGAEAFRSIDEMIGIHLNRPMTRLLVDTFPTFAKALSTALGGVAFGAVGFAATEVFERVSKGIEEARQAQDKFADSSRHAAETVTTVLGGLEEKLREASGDKSLKFSIQGAEEAKKVIEEIAKASDEAAKDAEKASGWWNRVKLDAGDFFENVARGGASIADSLLSSGFGSLNGGSGIKNKLFDPQELASMKDAIKDMRVDLEIALNTDAAKGTHTALALLATDIKATTGYLKDMEKAGDEAGKTLARGNLEFFGSAQTSANLSMAVAGRDAANAAAEEAKKAQEKLSELYKDMNASLAKMRPADPFNKIGEEIDAMRLKANGDLADITALFQKGIIPQESLDRANAGFKSLSDSLRSYRVELETALLAQQAQDLLAKPIPGVGKETPTQGFQLTSFAAPVTAGPAPAPPSLGAGGTTAAQFDVFSKDTLAQNKLVAASFEDAITPAEQYQLKIQELRLAFATLPAPLKDSVQAQEAFNAALAKLGAESTKAELHLLNLQKKLDELLSHSTSASDGVKAFFLNLEIESSQNGKFAFDFLNQGLKGFEDQLTKTVFTGKAHWRELFQSMTEEAFKFALNKSIVDMFQMVSGTGAGKSMGLAGLIPKLGGAAGGGLAGGGQAVAVTANTTALGANTTALFGLTAKMSLSGAGSGIPFLGGGAGAGVDAGAPIPFFAEGGDATPGSSFVSGESGAEQVDLDRSGGAHVTPLGFSAAKHGDTHNYYDQRGAVVTDDLMRKGDAVRMMAHTKTQAVGEAVANMSEIQRRTPQAGR